MIGLVLLWFWQRRKLLSSEIFILNYIDKKKKIKWRLLLWSWHKKGQWRNIRGWASSSLFKCQCWLWKAKFTWNPRKQQVCQWQIFRLQQKLPLIIWMMMANKSYLGYNTLDSQCFNLRQNRPNISESRFQQQFIMGYVDNKAFKYYRIHSMIIFVKNSDEQKTDGIRKVSC